jgi:Tfp pilus assembly protein PilN
MIEINLFPEGQRVRARTKKTGPGGFEPKYFIYLVPVIIGLLLSAHIYLFIAVTIKNSQFYILSSKWKALEFQRKELDKVKSESAVMSQDSRAIQQLLSQRVSWAENLNKLSLGLPAGVWFNEISLSGGNFLLRGSIVSLQKQEMNLIKIFMDNLKQDISFSADFSSLELGSVQKRVIGGYEVSDFSLSGLLKTK